MNAKEFHIYLCSKTVCPEAREWSKGMSLSQAWSRCHRGDWMLWLLQYSGYNNQIITKIKVKCARLVQHLMGDKRSLDALDVADKFALGKATFNELDKAALAASAAADDAYADGADAASAAAVAVAAVAADAADVYVDAADAAADAADVLSAAAAYAASASAVAAAAAYAASAYAVAAAAVDADASASAAAVAADASASAAAVAAVVYAPAAPKKILQQCADICREIIPQIVIP